MIEFFDSIEELKILPQHGDSKPWFFHNSMMTEENRTKLSVFHYECLSSKVYRRDTRDSSSSVYAYAGLTSNMKWILPFTNIQSFIRSFVVVLSLLFNFMF